MFYKDLFQGGLISEKVVLIWSYHKNNVRNHNSSTFHLRLKSW